MILEVCLGRLDSLDVPLLTIAPDDVRVQKRVFFRGHQLFFVVSCVGDTRLTQLLAHDV